MAFARWFRFFYNYVLLQVWNKKKILEIHSKKRLCQDAKSRFSSFYLTLPSGLCLPLKFKKLELVKWKKVIIKDCFIRALLEVAPETEIWSYLESTFLKERDVQNLKRLQNSVRVPSSKNTRKESIWFQKNAGALSNSWL